MKPTETLQLRNSLNEKKPINSKETYEDQDYRLQVPNSKVNMFDLSSPVTTNKTNSTETQSPQTSTNQESENKQLASETSNSTTINPNKKIKKRVNVVAETYSVVKEDPAKTKPDAKVKSKSIKKKTSNPRISHFTQSQTDNPEKAYDTDFLEHETAKIIKKSMLSELNKRLSYVLGFGNSNKEYANKDSKIDVNNTINNSVNVNFNVIVNKGKQRTESYKEDET